MATSRADQLLRNVPLFSRCSNDELSRLSRLASTVRIPAGKVVVRQGQPGREFLVIIEGEATVVIDDQAVATLGRGDFFGEIALLDGGPRTATVTADTDLIAEVMSHREFVTLLMDVPEVTRGILKGVAARLRAADANLVHGNLVH